MAYNLRINGIYWGYNPFAKHLLTSWDIQVVHGWWIRDDLKPETRNINNNTPSSQFRNTAVFDGGALKHVGGLLEGLAKIHNEVRNFTHTSSCVTMSLWI